MAINFYFDKAKVTAEGSYQELRASGLDFTKLLGVSVEKDILSDNESNAQNENAYGTNSRPTLTRQSSLQSVASSVESKLSKLQTEPIEEAETRSFGSISLSVYSSYFSAGGNAFTILILLFMCVLTQVLSSGGDYWLTYWYCL